LPGSDGREDGSGKARHVNVRDGVRGADSTELRRGPYYAACCALGQTSLLGSYSCLFRPHRLSILTKGLGVASLRAHSPHRHRTGVPAQDKRASQQPFFTKGEVLDSTLSHVCVASKATEVTIHWSPTEVASRYFSIAITESKCSLSLRADKTHMTDH
jgi:hypothetical protein